MAKNSKVLAGLSAAIVFGLAGGAQAAPVTIYDTAGTTTPANTEYWGGVNVGTGNADVIGNARFEIFKMVVDRVGDNLSVVVHTNYAQNIGAEGSALGTLFIGAGNQFNPQGTLNNNLTGDTFAADMDRFGYAFDYTTRNGTALGTNSAPYLADSGTVNPGLGGLGDGGNATLYDLSELGGDVRQSDAFFTNGFRKDQAVDINNTAVATTVGGTWSIGNGTISFDIVNFFTFSGLPAIYQTSMTLAWAMTCANDVVMATIAVPGKAGEVPLPAGLLLLLSGLTGLGFMGRFKAKTAKSLA